MNLKKYNNLLTSVRWSTMYPNDSHNLALVGVAQKIINPSKKTPDKYKRDPKKGEPYYIRDLPI